MNIKTKLALNVVNRLLAAAERLTDSIDQLTELQVHMAKTLTRIERLLDEQADIQAQTRDAIAAVPEVAQ